MLVGPVNSQIGHFFPDLARIHYTAGKYLMKKNKNIILNCGYGKGISVLDVINVAKKLYSKNFLVKFDKKRKGDLPEVVASNDRLKKYFRWSPIFNNLTKILKDSFMWQKKLQKLKRLYEK